jgi:ferritin-like metal-binding protein YciE
MHMMASDEVLKHALASNAFEHLEAAYYRSLAAPPVTPANQK